MKKITTLILLFSNLIGNSQCPAPANVNIVDNINLLNTAELSWTETGNANNWEIAIMPDYMVGSALPTTSWISATTNPFVITGIPPTNGCYVFFVRSACSSTDVSAWTAVTSLSCSTNIITYLASLSNESFALNDNSRVQLAPNPSKNVVKINSNSKIDTITVYDCLGKVILTQTQNNNEINVEYFSKGVYIIEVVSENKKNYKKFIKE